MARNCYAYLDHVYKVDDKRVIPQQTIEFTWAGYRLPNATIGSGSTRRFDAFFVYHNDPSRIMFQTFATATEFTPRIPTQGDFLLTYAVVSENFPPARGTFALHVDRDLEKIRFTMVRRERECNTDVRT